MPGGGRCKGLERHPAYGPHRWCSNGEHRGVLQGQASEQTKEKNQDQRPRFLFWDRRAGKFEAPSHPLVFVCIKKNRSKIEVQQLPWTPPERLPALIYIAWQLRPCNDGGRQCGSSR